MSSISVRIRGRALAARALSLLASCLLPLLKGTPEEFVAALGAAPTKVMALKPGDKVEF